MKKVLLLILFPKVLFAQDDIKSKLIGEWQMKDGWSVCRNKRVSLMHYQLYTFQMDGTYSSVGNSVVNRDTIHLNGKYKLERGKIHLYDNKIGRNSKISIEAVEEPTFDVSFRDGELNFSDSSKETGGCPYTYIFTRTSPNKKEH